MTKKVGEYELGKVLGEGSFGLVRLATHSKTKETVAMKIIEKEKIKRDDLLDHLKKEIAILKVVNHRNIVKLHEVLASKTKIYLVLEFINGKELWQHLEEKGKIDEDDMRRIFRQIIRAIEYCKSKNIAHRDLKPENILINTEGVIKVSDFGLSALYKDPTNITYLLHTTCGTIHYLAPEVIQNLGYEGHMADVWSLGVILYVCVAGYPPFNDDNISRLLEKIVAAQYDIPKNFSKNLKDLTKSILNPNPKKRITIEHIKNHSWVLDQMTPDELKTFFENEEPMKSSSDPILIPVDFDSNIVDDSPGSFSISPNVKTNHKLSIFGYKDEPIEIKPRKMGAFELMNFLNGKLVTRIFLLDVRNSVDITPSIILKELTDDKKREEMKKKIELCQSFTVTKNRKDIYEIIMNAFKQTEAVDIFIDNPANGLKINASFTSTKTKPVSLSCEVLELTTQLFLINFANKTEAQHNEYLHVYKKILEALPESFFMS